MKLFKHLLLLFILLFSTLQIHAQIPAKGNIILGDSTQQHIVTTLTGDKFTGRVVSFDADKITFEYRGSELVFPIADVQMVEVKEKSANVNTPEEPFSYIGNKQITADEAKNYSQHFYYRITDSKGKVIIGKLVKFNKFRVSIERGNAKNLIISSKGIKSIELLGRKITDNPIELNEYQKLTTDSGSKFIGQLLSFDGETFEFLAKNDWVVKFPKNEVTIIQLGDHSGQHKRIQIARQHLYNPQRVFFTPSAFTLEKGVSEYRNTMVIHNTVDHGLTDNLTIGAGLSTILVSNALSGKVKVGGSLSRHLHVAAGVQGLFILPAYGSDAETLALLYGALSIGTKDRFLSFSVGLGKSNYENENTAGISIGGALRTGRNWRILMEIMYFNPNESVDYYYDNSNTSMGTLGMSWFKGIHQIDFGLYATTFDYGSVLVLPMAAYSLRF